MTAYVLVHGGWHGGWCWNDVAKRLRAFGHDVYCPTMTGLGERSHLVDAVEGPDTHVTDIENVLRWNELENVVLVGHSYGGMIIGGVATRVPERIAHLVYLDAFVPVRDGQSPSDMSIASRAAEIAKAAEGHAHIPPSGFERWSEDPDRREWLRRMTTPQPRSCFQRGVSRIDDPTDLSLARTYILCGRHEPSPFEQFHERYQDDPKWTCHIIDCLHDAMLDRPEELANLLNQCSED